MKDQKDQTFNPYIRMAYEDRHMSTSKYNLMLFVSFFDFANNSLVVYTTRERSHTHTPALTVGTEFFFLLTNI